MRRMALIAGVIAALAVAALTLNTANGAPRAAQGSVISLVAATRTIAAADRDEVALAARTTPEAKTTSEPAEKPGVEARAAVPNFTISAACQQAIDNLKTLHQADVAEDASERTAQPQTAATAAADLAEDAAEAQKWVKALMAARAACLPQPTAACQAEIAILQIELQTTRTEELAELSASTRDQSDWLADWMSIRTAFSAVATACATRE